jgi:hypothetical protein
MPSVPGTGLMPGESSDPIQTRLPLRSRTLNAMRRPSAARIGREAATISDPEGGARSMNVGPFASVAGEAKRASTSAPTTAAAASPAAPSSHEWRGRGRAAVARASSPLGDVPLIDSSANARSLADWNRASGRLSRHRITMRSSVGARACAHFARPPGTHPDGPRAFPGPTRARNRRVFNAGSRRGHECLVRDKSKLEGTASTA